MPSEADIVSLRVTLRYKDLDEFAQKYAENISSAGLFLRTKAPKPTGTKIRFELLLSDGSRALRGEGVVVLVREGDKPGMAIRYNSLDPESHAVVEKVVAAYGQGALAPTPLSTRFGKPATTPAVAPAPRLRSAVAPWTARPAPAGWNASGLKSSPNPSSLPRRSLRSLGESSSSSSDSAEPAASRTPETTPEATAPKTPAEGEGQVPRKRSSVPRPWAKSGANTPTTQELTEQIRGKEPPREDPKSALERTDAERLNRARARESSAGDVAKASERHELRPLDRRDTELDATHRIPVRRPDSFDIEPPVEAAESSWTADPAVTEVVRPERAPTVLDPTPPGAVPAADSTLREGPKVEATPAEPMEAAAAERREHTELARSAPDRAPTEIAEPLREWRAERAATVIEPSPELRLEAGSEPSIRIEVPEVGPELETPGDTTIDSTARVPVLGALDGDEANPVEGDDEIRAIEAELERREAAAREEARRREAAALEETRRREEEAPEAESRREHEDRAALESEAQTRELEARREHEEAEARAREAAGARAGDEAAEARARAEHEAREAAQREAEAQARAEHEAAEARARAEHEAAEARARAEHEAAEARARAEHEAAEARARAEHEAAEARARAEHEAREAAEREAEARARAEYEAAEAHARAEHEARLREAAAQAEREAEARARAEHEAAEAHARAEHEARLREAAEREAVAQAEREAEARARAEHEAAEAHARAEHEVRLREATILDARGKGREGEDALERTLHDEESDPMFGGEAEVVEEPALEVPTSVASEPSEAVGLGHRPEMMPLRVASSVDATPREDIALELRGSATTPDTPQVALFGRAQEVTPLTSPAEIDRTPLSETEANSWAAGISRSSPDADAQASNDLPPAPMSASRDLPPTEAPVSNTPLPPRAPSGGHEGQVSVTGVAQAAASRSESEAAPSARPPPRLGPARVAIERDLTGSIQPVDPADVLPTRRAEIRATSDITVRPARDDGAEAAPPPPRTEGPATLIGIDFGGRWLRMCTTQSGTNEFIPIGPALFIPALVGARSDGTLVVGTKARAIFLDDPWRTVAPRSLLRLLTNGTIDPASRPQNVRLEGGRVRVDLGTRSVEFEEIATALFKHLRDGAAVHLRDSKLAAAVSIPNDLDPAAVALLSRACQAAGFESVKLVREADALLQAYKLDDPRLETALLIDVGATHLGLTLSRRDESGAFGVVTSRWLEDLSAADLDARIVELALEELKAQKEDTSSKDPALRSKLLEAVERARIDIRRNATVELKVSLQSPGASNVAIERTIKLQRSRIYEVTEEPVRQICTRVQDLLRDAGLHPRQLGATILAGSAGLYPPLLQALTVLTSKDPLASVPTAHVYAVGLARSEAVEAAPPRTAAPRPSSKAPPPPPLTATADVRPATADLATRPGTGDLGARPGAGDLGARPGSPPLAPSTPAAGSAPEANGSATLSSSVGIALPGGRFRPLLKKGDALPAQMTRKHTTTREDQTEVEIELFEGETELLKDATRLGNVTLRDVPRKARGAVQIEMTIEVDRDEAVTITLFEPTSNNRVEQVFATKATPPERRQQIADKAAQLAAEEAARGPAKKGGLLSRLLGRS